MSLLAGAVVFIDDELETELTAAAALLQEVKETGRPVASFLGLPTDPESWFEHWQSLAFVILDWDLSPNSGGSKGGSTLGDFERQKLYDFVDLLMQRIFCPIFIISAEDIPDIKRQLQQNQNLLTPSGELDARCAVFGKDVLMSNLISHLQDWVSKSPALSALGAWERGYDSAKNTLFIDLNRLEPDWPRYVWNAAEDDEVDPAFELTSVINTNLHSRFDPVVFDVDAIAGYSGPISGHSRRQVSQGRTVVQAERLSSNTVLPGDLFKLPGAADGELWINVSPACHTVGRVKKMGESEETEPIRLHLLRGERQISPTTLKQWRNLDEMRKRTNSILVHTVLEGQPYLFSFGDAQIRDWEGVSDSRVARLLPPFITRVQQLHAAYIQSEALPRVTHDLYDIAGLDTGVPSSSTS